MKKNNTKTISVTRANLLGLLLIPILAIPFCIYNNLWGSLSLYPYINSPYKIIYFLLITFFLVFLHELIHAVFFACFSKNNWKNVKIGFIWKYLTPYAHCGDPLKINHYRIALLAPCILLGIIPLMVALVIGDYFLLIFGSLLTLAAGGDIIIYILTLKVLKDKLLLDHSSECGFHILD
jgi:hypothetical protein